MDYDQRFKKKTALKNDDIPAKLRCELCMISNSLREKGAWNRLSYAPFVMISGMPEAGIRVTDGARTHDPQNHNLML